MFLGYPVKVIFFISLFATTGCTLKKIKFVDEAGQIIPDVLVLSGARSHYIGNNRRVFCISDSEGAAYIKSNYTDLIIYKPGYYPIVNDSLTPNGGAWSKYVVSSPVILYKVPSGQYKNPVIRDIEIKQRIEDRNIGLGIEDEFLKGKVNVFFNKKNRAISVTALEGWDISGANKFYFDDNFHLHELYLSNITQSNFVIFYLINKLQHKIFKVAIFYKGDVSGYSKFAYELFGLKVASINDNSIFIYWTLESQS